MVQLQSDGYGSSYFHKLWVEYYCLGENQESETFCSKCFRCQCSCQLQNHKILSTHRGHKNAFGQNFWNLIFFLIRKDKVIDIIRKKNHVGPTLSSYINLTLKQWIKSAIAQKNRSKFYIFWEVVSQFCFRQAHLFGLHKAVRNDEG